MTEIIEGMPAAVAAAGRITRKNFRLVHRLFTQVARIMKIDNRTVITSDVPCVTSSGSCATHHRTSPDARG